MADFIGESRWTDRFIEVELMDGRFRILARVPKGQGEPEDIILAKTVTNKVYFCDDPGLDWYLDNVPCRRACPADTRIPEYIDSASLGDYDKSYEINLADNVLPHTLGRVCAHPCEDKCRHGHEGMGEPVSICWMKRSGADHKRSEITLQKADSTGKRVAIVGAGPAGLTAAQDLSLWGHAVTIFEEMKKPGGMLRYGIPRFRLPENLIDQEIGQIVDLGVAIKTEIRIGKDITVEDLAGEFDAVILAAGCMVAQSLGAANEEAEGVINGLDFMMEVNKGSLNKVHGSVIIIGGGFTAMDCARTACRLGAKKVSVVYRRTRNELKVDDREIMETSIEGVEFHYLLSPETIEVDGDNRVKGIMFQRNTLTEPGADGRRGVEPVEGKDSKVFFDADWIIPAVSQSADKTFIGAELTINDDSSTSVDKVFVTGDFASGPSNIISAIGAAHETARAVDKLLMGLSRFETKVKKKEWPQRPFGSYKGWKTIEGNIFDLIPKLDNPSLPVSARRDQNVEVDKGYDKDQTYWQGQRCFLCNHNIQIDETQCILCYNCVDVCPYNCILMLREDNVRVNENGEQVAENKGYTYMVIDEKNCVRCGLCIDACPPPCITMEKMEVTTVFNK